MAGATTELEFGRNGVRRSAPGCTALLATGAPHVDINSVVTPLTSNSGKKKSGRFATVRRSLASSLYVIEETVRSLTDGNVVVRCQASLASEVA